MTGFTSRPEVQRPNRNGIYIFVNRRLVRDRLLLHAIGEAYRNIMPPGVFPVVLLFLDLPYQEVDVNVHPAKIEVRFRHPQFVHDFTRDALRHALSLARPIPGFPAARAAAAATAAAAQRGLRSRARRASAGDARPGNGCGTRCAARAAARGDSRRRLAQATAAVARGLRIVAARPTGRFRSDSVSKPGAAMNFPLPRRRAGCRAHVLAAVSPMLRPAVRRGATRPERCRAPEKLSTSSRSGR